MRVIRSSEMEFVAASHEEKSAPGSLKKVLCVRDDLIPGRVQMINWAMIAVGNEFRPHYHEDMQEAFVILEGQAEITIGGEKERLSKGDLVLIPERAVHVMKNIGPTDLHYIALGIARETGGKTVVVEA